MKKKGYTILQFLPTPSPVARAPWSATTQGRQPRVKGVNVCWVTMPGAACRPIHIAVDHEKVRTARFPSLCRLPEQVQRGIRSEVMI